MKLIKHNNIVIFQSRVTLKLPYKNRFRHNLKPCITGNFTFKMNFITDFILIFSQLSKTV